MNKGEIDLATPVLDVSKNNDWSRVRVWHIPSGQFGTPRLFRQRLHRQGADPPEGPGTTKLGPMAPVVSIATPSFNRPKLLEAQHRIVTTQSVQDFEWLILDDSPEPAAYFASLNDPRIRYTHMKERMIVAAKRNWLCERSSGAGDRAVR